jgi:branched-chain amino acid aminotransferase
MIVWRNGDYINANGAVSAADRGYLIGDGVFETMLVRNGVPAFLVEHVSRLQRGADALALGARFYTGVVRKAIDGLTSKDVNRDDAVCRMTVTRSGGARGLAPSSDAGVEIVIALHPAPPPKPQFSLVLSRHRRLSSADTNGFKCIGAYAANLMARIEAGKAGADEAILLNEHGRVACAAAANLFVISDGGLITPPEGEGATPGVTRAKLFEVAADLGVSVSLEPVTLEMLEGSPLILTNSVMGVAAGSMMGAQAPASALATRLKTAYERKLALEFSGRAA